MYYFFKLREKIKSYKKLKMYILRQIEAIKNMLMLLFERFTWHQKTDESETLRIQSFQRK